VRHFLQSRDWPHHDARHVELGLKIERRARLPVITKVSLSMADVLGAAGLALSDESCRIFTISSSLDQAKYFIDRTHPLLAVVPRLTSVPQAYEVLEMYH
jgi:hypothetical protein